MSKRKWSEIFALFSTGEVLLGQPPGSGEENDGFWGGGPKRGGSRGGYPWGGGAKMPHQRAKSVRGTHQFIQYLKHHFRPFLPPPLPPPIFSPETAFREKKYPTQRILRAQNSHPPPELRQTGVSGKRMFDIADWNSESVTQVLLVYRYLNGWNYSIEYGAIEDGVYAGRVSKRILL